MFFILTFFLYAKTTDISKERLKYIETSQTQGLVLIFEESPSANERNQFSNKFKNKGLQIDQNTNDTHSLFFIWETPQNVQKAIDICRQLSLEGLLSEASNLKYCEPIFPLHE